MFNYKRRKSAGEENQDSKSENLDNMEYWKQLEHTNKYVVATLC